MTTTEQNCFLPNGDRVDVRARWKWQPGLNDGSFTNQKGWELYEHWIVGMPHASLSDRVFVGRQLTAPEHAPE